jgi:uncharacterized membrane protein YraQ (UPF0718 family)/YHS domain-containing protein
VNWLDDAGNSLREAFYMFWQTLWPLILGFSLSGAVQAFVSRDQMQRVLGDHRPKAIARATGLGMVSSSCSYAATAMAKSLFAKGADFTTAMVFMFASTNLVLELGIVLFILLGWQFAAAEFVGGPIMIILLVGSAGLVLRGGVVEVARQRLRRGDGAADHDHAHGGDTPTVARRVLSKAGWADAASYTMADLWMLRRELVIGYLVAGALTVLVPMSAWNDVFQTGHGTWTSIENALVAPFIAVIAFVCSVGNVPLAASLWRGGLSFGGVVAFIFADLITLPLLLIYRKYYGTRLTLRLTAWFWLVMSAAGLAVEGIFAAVGWIPNRPHHGHAGGHMGVEWNYTTFLNVAFLGLFAYLYYLKRNRDRFGGGAGLAIDPVCGMQVETANAPATGMHGGEQLYFCSDHCSERYTTSLSS